MQSENSMEQDRYQKNHKIFIIGLFSLLLSLSLFAFSFYVMPNLLFGWYYDVPLFVMNLVEWLQYSYNYSSGAASKLIFLVIFLSALFFAGVAYYCSNRIDNQIYSSELQSQKKTKSKRDGLRLALKILVISILVFIAATLLEWSIYTPPPADQSTNGVSVNTESSA